LNSGDGLLLNQDELIEKMKQKLAEIGATIDEPLTQEARFMLNSAQFLYVSALLLQHISAVVFDLSLR